MKGDYRFIKAVKLVDLKEGDEVLDLGSANDILLKYIKKKVDYTSVDWKGTKINYPKHYGSIQKQVNYNLEKGLPPQIKKKRYDAIFLLEIIEHIENFKTLLKQCRDSLKDDGKIIISTPTNNRFMRGEDPTHFHTFRKANLKNIAKWLKMKYAIYGAHIRIPVLDLFIPSNQTLYNDTFIMILKKE